MIHWINYKSINNLCLIFFEFPFGKNINTMAELAFTLIRKQKKRKNSHFSILSQCEVKTFIYFSYSKPRVRKRKEKKKNLRRLQKTICEKDEEKSSVRKTIGKYYRITSARCMNRIQNYQRENQITFETLTQEKIFDKDKIKDKFFQLELK